MPNISVQPTSAVRRLLQSGYTDFHVLNFDRLPGVIEYAVRGPDANGVWPSRIDPSSRCSIAPTPLAPFSGPFGGSWARPDDRTQPYLNTALERDDLQ
jgi:hypothetical protein